MVLDYLRRHHIALIALFIALGGTSYAAVKLPANSVGAKQIKKDAVGTSEVKAGAVGASEIKNGSITPTDLKPGQQLKGDPGAKGDPGPKGAPGPTAASFASHDPMDFALATDETQVITLTDSTSGRSGGLLSVPFNARVVVNASLRLYETGSTTSILCRAKIAPLGGSYTAISQQTADAIDVNTQMPITAAVDVGPGTYNVQVACSYFGGAAAWFDKGDLTAVATAR